MLIFFTALITFLASHMLVSRTRLKPWIVKRVGHNNYLLLYSGISLALLWWLIHAARIAPRVPLWPWVHGLYWIPNLVMPLACILLVSGFVVPNPFSIATHSHGFNPEKPGLIIALTRHPILWGFFLWALSHLIVNGEFPLAFMFLIFMIMSLLGIPLLDHRKRREIGVDSWTHMAKNTHSIIFCGRALRSGKFRLTKLDIAGIIIGLVLYVIAFLAHQTLFGINPTPPF
ncbi:NnrU family protein [Micavibrio aeruginosavorus]|uniref:NnrU family protein, required for expression of nitric oxide and nitrite reductases (Nir and Nor) n=1 Tax=Micavibrio aeruginosavorus EPB TaxID=349215 RepID=M4VGQ2_9BACT|nr:NnrU family protein [Micavibrio aeruginosavorus]AGH97660.1 NnrU family protein, required for expression of nitric oxide and nitrite reductases (Nir and Nor) [Micavibrio aeruginosavorus EPB]